MEKFLVQSHNALKAGPHIDFHLQKGDVFESWVFPKALPKELGERRLAIESNQHSLSCGNFEGVQIIDGYGAGTMVNVDRGFYDVVKVKGDDQFSVRVQGTLVNGTFCFVKLKNPRFRNGGRVSWLVIRNN